MVAISSGRGRGPGYTIGALGAAAGVNPETIRYYERIGLMPAPPRSTSGYRHYGEAAVRRLRFIRRGRELGFAIAEITGLLNLHDRPDAPCGEADALTREHLAQVEAKIADLQALRGELARLASCGSKSARHCRLIEALEEKGCCG
ncbi:MAG TPA: MerR family DNA-binding protein [Burkholderiales bacterium]